MRSFLSLILSFVIFSVADIIIVKHEIKRNINLFYSLHKNIVDKEIKKIG